MTITDCTVTCFDHNVVLCKCIVGDHLMKLHWDGTVCFDCIGNVRGIDRHRHRPQVEYIIKFSRNCYFNWFWHIILGFIFRQHENGSMYGIGKLVLPLLLLLLLLFIDFHLLFTVYMESFACPRSYILIYNLVDVRNFSYACLVCLCDIVLVLLLICLCALFFFFSV